MWRFVLGKQWLTGTRSPKQNMSDILRSHPRVVKELRQELRYPEGASGIAVAVHDRIVGIDLFDKPSTLEKLWDRLVVLGTTFDALDVRDAGGQRDGNGGSVRLYMERIRSMKWQEFATVGLGKLHRAVGDDGSLAAALVVDGKPLHLSVSIPVRKQGD